MWVCSGRQRSCGKKRAKGPKGRAGSSRPGPALSCGMTLTHVHTRTHTHTRGRRWPPSLLSSLNCHLPHFPGFFSLPDSVTGSCWQGCAEAKVLPEEAGLLSPPPHPSGPEPPCPMVQYLSSFLPLSHLLL